MEEELKRLLLTASKPRSKDGGGKTDGKDGSEANSGKKIRKRRAKRRPKDGSGEEGDSGGAAGGASASSSSSKTSSSSARGTTYRAQQDKGGPTYPNGHPLRGRLVDFLSADSSRIIPLIMQLMKVLYFPDRTQIPVRG